MARKTDDNALERPVCNDETAGAIPAEPKTSCKKFYQEQTDNRVWVQLQGGAASTGTRLISLGRWKA